MVSTFYSFLPCCPFLYKPPATMLYAVRHLNTPRPTQVFCMHEPLCLREQALPLSLHGRPSDALQVGNIQLGIPVRLIRKNVDKGSEQGNILIYDGLYNVVRLFYLLRVEI